MDESKKRLKQAVKHMNIGYPTRKELVKANLEGKLLPDGEQLTFFELEFLWNFWYQGRSDLFPERYPRMNGGNIDEVKSRNYWGELYDQIKDWLNDKTFQWGEEQYSKMVHYVDHNLHLIFLGRE